MIDIPDNLVFLTPIIVLLLAGVFLFVTISSIRSAFFPSKKQLKKKFEEPVEEIPPQIVGARVMDKRTDVFSGGGAKSPHHELLFFVSFLTDDGETKEYRVTQEIYEKCQLYQTGDLVTIDGIFFDFGEGEPIE